MAKFTPHHNLHKIISRLQAVTGVLFWAVFILSFSSLLLPLLDQHREIKEGIDIINIISILIFFSLDVIIEFVLFPHAEHKRREDFIDNSFGSKFSTSNSIEYYDNDEVSTGLYKATVNLFENVFFTCSIAKSLTWRKIILPTIVLLSIWVMAYYGFKEVPFALTFLQVFFSAQILGDLVKHLVLLTQLDRIQSDLVRIFQHGDVKFKIDHYSPEIYRCWLSYESLLSRIRPEIPNTIFAKMNSSLSEKWLDLKNKHSIQ